MTLFLENETDKIFAFDVEETARQVIEGVLDMEECPYETQVNVLLTDNEGIREYNREYRSIDRETDVLSFPNLEFETPGVYEVEEEEEADCFDPDTGELILGDIIISVDRVAEQAESYGHSPEKGICFPGGSRYAAFKRI